MKINMLNSPFALLTTMGLLFATSCSDTDESEYTAADAEYAIMELTSQAELAAEKIKELESIIEELEAETQARLSRIEESACECQYKE